MEHAASVLLVKESQEAFGKNMQRATQSFQDVCQDYEDLVAALEEQLAKERQKHGHTRAKLQASRLATQELQEENQRLEAGIRRMRQRSCSRTAVRSPAQADRQPSPKHRHERSVTHSSARSSPEQVSRESSPEIPPPPASRTRTPARSSPERSSLSAHKAPSARGGSSQMAARTDREAYEAERAAVVACPKCDRTMTKRHLHRHHQQICEALQAKLVKRAARTKTPAEIRASRQEPCSRCGRIMTKGHLEKVHLRRCNGSLLKN